MSQEIRLIIADDHPIVRQGLRQIIEQEADLKVLAEAGDGAAAVRNAVALKPDVIILDVDMPKMNGFDALRRLSELELKVAAIILTVHCEKSFFNEAMKAGAKGYVLKDSAITDIVSSIRAVAAGQNYVSPAVTSYLLNPQGDAANKSSALPQLTPTEQQILQLIADYKTNNQIAETLFISPNTVKSHRKNICLKLKLEGNHALMKFALENK